MDTVRSSNTDAWDAVVFSDDPHNALTGEEPLLPVKYFGMLFCFELVKEGFIESADIPFERLGFEVLVRHFVCDIRRCLNHPFIVVAEQWALKPLVIGRGHIIIIARTFRIGPTCFVLLNSCPRTLFSHQKGYRRSTADDFVSDQMCLHQKLTATLIDYPGSCLLPTKFLFHKTLFQKTVRGASYQMNLTLFFPHR